MRRGLIVLGVLAIAGTAWAYMLPADALLRKMEQKREDQHVFSLVVQGSYTLTGTAAQSLAQKLGRFAEGGELSVPAVATYKMPGRCRIDLNLPAAPRPYAVDRNGVVSGSDEMKDAQTLLQLGCPLLASRGSPEETKLLREWAATSKVDFDVTSLARANNAVAEVIGAGPHDKLKPQIWIDKDELVPLRVILKKGDAFYDLRFDPGVGILDSHPRTLELWQMGTGDGGEQLLARFSAEKIEPNAKVDDKLFQ
ncbi:MAG: hypothetical protein JST54_06685 [Deltaproteobacteria bacterium]|nr:hypothetical protein [Deltaproteobacteria bacterium]